MKRDNGKVEGDVHVEQDLTFGGMITGNATVCGGVCLHLQGTCCGDLIVEAGGTAFIDGVVAGNVLNQGTVKVSGVVHGNVLSKKASFERSTEAVVHGNVQC